MEGSAKTPLLLKKNQRRGITEISRVYFGQRWARVFAPRGNWGGFCLNIVDFSLGMGVRGGQFFVTKWGKPCFCLNLTELTKSSWIKRKFSKNSEKSPKFLLKIRNFPEKHINKPKNFHRAFGDMGRRVRLRRGRVSQNFRRQGGFGLTPPLRAILMSPIQGNKMTIKFNTTVL